MTERIVFQDRTEAGIQLAEMLLGYTGEDTLVLGIPGGGVVVGAEIARRLGVPLSTVQLTVASNREAIEQRMRSRLGGRSMFESSRHSTSAMSRSRSTIPTATMPDVTDRTVIVVDDGLHDDGEVHQTLMAFRGRGAKKVIFAVPFIDQANIDRHSSEVDAVIAVAKADLLQDRREWYETSASPALDEVSALLKRYGPAALVETVPATLYQRILVPFDFSEPAQQALVEAMRIAEVSQSKVALLYVSATPVRYDPDRDANYPEKPREREQLDRLEDLCIELAAEGKILETRLRVGDAAASILDEISAGEHDLVVMGTHGRTGLQRLLLGSVAQKVSAASPCPVLVVS